MRAFALISIASLTFTLSLVGCSKSESESTPESTNVEAPSGAAKPGAAAKGNAGNPSVAKDGTVKAGNVEVKPNGDVKAGDTEAKANGDVKAGNVEVKDGTVKVPGLPPIQTGQ